MNTITINGQTIDFAPGATVLETALAHGIDIPRLCYHPVSYTHLTLPTSDLV